MAHRTVLTHSSVLPRLIAAIGAGSLLASAGCGGQTRDTSPGGQESNGTESESQTSVTGGETSASQTLASEGGPTETNESATGVNTSGSTGDSSAETSGQTSGAQDSSTSPPVTSETLDSSTSDETSSAALVCEFGQPQRFCLNAAQMESQARYGVGNVPLEPPRSEEEIAAAWDENQCMKYQWIATGCCNPAVGPGEPQPDGTCCYQACEGACCGRPFVVDGVALVAGLRSGARWLLSEPAQGWSSELLISVELDADARRRLAAAWLQDAQMEHASIASFAQFSMDLLRLGAPPELIRDSHLAGIDEIEHARIAFSIAQRLDGEAREPAPLQLTSLTLHSLQDAVAAAICEGCVGETLASGVIAEQARRCLDPDIASRLNQIAEDELRHAELAWRFVAWALQEFGDQVRSVVRSTFDVALSRAPEAPAALALSDAQLHSAGRISRTEWEQTVAHLMNAVLEPAVATLLHTRQGSSVNESTAARALL